MLALTTITDDSVQTQNFTLEDGTIVTIAMKFVPMQYGWFITSISYLGFQINGLRITNNPNMLRQWKNLIPFGLACFSTANREPSQQQDFSSGNSVLYILSAEEVQQYEESLSG